MELKVQVTQIHTTEGIEYSAEILGLPSIIKCIRGGTRGSCDGRIRKSDRPRRPHEIKYYG